MTQKTKVDRESIEAVTTKITNLLLRKNADYGDAWQKHGLAGVLVRLSDKSLRLENIAGREYLSVDESARDTLQDIAGYAILGLMKMEQEGADE